jgi:hypothetical protein
MMTEFRPVDCFTKQPLTFEPGYVNQSIYGDRVETGWSWNPYNQNTDQFWAPVRATFSFLASPHLLRFLRSMVNPGQALPARPGQKLSTTSRACLHPSRSSLSFGHIPGLFL